MPKPPQFPTLRETELGIKDGPIDGAALRDIFKRLLSQTNPGLDATNKSLSKGLTPSEHFRCETITVKATHAVPLTVRLKTLKQAASCLIAGFDTALPVGAAIQMLQPSQSGGVPTAQVTVWFNAGGSTVGNVRLWLFEDGLQMTSAPSFVSAGKQPVIQGASTSCGAFTTTSGAYVDVTNLSVTLTSTGRQVVLFLQPDGIAPASVNVNSTLQDGTLAIVRDGSVIAEWVFRDAISGFSTFAPAFMIDTGASAAAHTWKLRAKVGGGVALGVNNYVLAGYEL